MELSSKHGAEGISAEEVHCVSTLSKSAVLLHFSIRLRLEFHVYNM